MIERRLVVGIYALVGALGATVALAVGHDPLRATPAFERWPLLETPVASLSPFVRDGVSAALGLAIAGVAITSARLFVSRFEWARTLHAQLEPVVRGNSDRDLVLLALASGIAEELLFRGLLVQVTGVVISSLLFGVLHQVRGPARVAWMLWATLMGMLLGWLFVVTGSLAGPVVAHVVTNAVNLKFVRDHGAPTPPRTLASLMR